MGYKRSSASNKSFEDRQEETREKQAAIRDRITEQFLGLMESGIDSFRERWDKSGGSPMNPTTGAPYTRGNMFNLGMTQLINGWGESRWATYKQCTWFRHGTSDRLTESEHEKNKFLGRDDPAKIKTWSVRAGEKGTMIQRALFSATKNMDRDSAEDDENSKNGAGTFRGRVFPYVFNASQIDGIPPRREREIGWSPHEVAEGIMSNCGVPIVYGGTRACYVPDFDRIHLPERGRFTSDESFYGVCLHEVGHSTGHKSRMNRDLSGEFGSERYATEELYAELSSMMVNAEVGILNSASDNAQYVKSWMRAIRERPGVLFEAIDMAHQIADRVLEYDRDRLLDRHAWTDEALLERYAERPVELSMEGRTLGGEQPTRNIEPALELSL